MKVAIIGLGEAGYVFAEAFANTSAHVSAYTPRPRSTPESVALASTASDAVEDADLVLSLVRSRAALTAAEDCAPSMKQGSIFVDFNAAAPAAKRDVAEALGSEVRTVDGALVGSVRQYGASVPVLLSGKGSAQAAQHLATVGTHAEDLGGEVGEASGRKLLRSIFMKGLAALIDETLTIGIAAGHEEWVRKQIAGVLQGGEKPLDRLATGIQIHAERRSAEVEDSLSLAQEFGEQWPMVQGTLTRHLLIAEQNTTVHGPSHDAQATV